MEGSHDLQAFAHLSSCFNARSRAVSAFAKPWRGGVVALSALLQVEVASLDYFNSTFGTVPLTPDQGLVCAAMGSVVLWFSERRKLRGRSLDR